MQVAGFRAVQPAYFGAGQVQLLHGAGNADIGQAALFFQTVGGLHAHFVREQSFFQSGNEHQRKLQSLGTVQGHQLHAVFVYLGLGFACFQYGMVEKCHQWRQIVLFILFVAECQCGMHQLVQVFHTGLAFLAFFFLVIHQQSAVFNDMTGAFVQLQPGGGGFQLFDQLHKAQQRIAGTAREQLVFGHVQHGVPQRALLLAGKVAQLFQGFVADTTRRHIDDTLDGTVIMAAA